MRNLINGKQVDASNGSAIEVNNPARNQLIATVPNSTVEDVADAVKVAVSAWKKWSEVPLHERCRLMYKFLSLVETNKEMLASTLCRESGKPIREARREVANTKRIVSAYVDQVKHLYGVNVPVGNKPGNEATLQFSSTAPLGVVACLIPADLPCDAFSQKVPAALLMGNSVIVKPSNTNPLTIHKYCLLLQEAGIPNGVINCLSGDNTVIGQALASNKDVKLITFAGASSIAKQLMTSASTNLNRTILDVGTNDSFIVAEDADLDLAAKEAIAGRLYNSGQLYCSSKKFIIHNSIKEKFTLKLLTHLSELSIGDPLTEAVQLGCLVNERAASLIEDQVRTTLAQGAILAYGGRRMKSFFEPTVLVNINKDMDIMKNMEVFGPVFPIIGFDTIEEALEIANQSDYTLCTNIFTKDIANALKISEKIKTSGLVVNGASNYHTTEMSYGGWPDMGLGSEGIASTLKQMSKDKTTILKNILK